MDKHFMVWFFSSSRRPCGCVLFTWLICDENQTQAYFRNSVNYTNERGRSLLFHLHVSELLCSAFLKLYLNNHTTFSHVGGYFILTHWKLYLIKWPHNDVWLSGRMRFSTWVATVVPPYLRFCLLRCLLPMVNQNLKILHGEFQK